MVLKEPNSTAAIPWERRTRIFKVLDEPETGAVLPLINGHERKPPSYAFLNDRKVPFERENLEGRPMVGKVRISKK